ncbi:hypothetical protein L0244_21590, partial [bacterium]|nr:hypothetical protein [bacterium]
MDWKEAIAFMQSYQERNSDDRHCQIIWKKLQLGNRTQDILMDVEAIKALQDDIANKSPEWDAAMKWLNYQRAQKSDLMLDMLWKQIESGNRTDELLQLIRLTANASQTDVGES